MLILWHLFSLSLVFCVSIVSSQSNVNCDCVKNGSTKAVSDIDKCLDFETVTTESQKITRIECLLRFKGNKTPYWGVATSNEVSQTFGPSPFEVIALYKISSLLYGKMDFALAMVLVDENEKLNSAKSIKIAYRSYESWLEKVKKIGLYEVQKQKLDPLAGSRVHWYGLFL